MQWRQVSILMKRKVISMNFLKIENKKSFFVISDKKIEPENIDKDDLLEILELVYEHSSSIKFPKHEELEEIANHIEREIVSHIISKLRSEEHTYELQSRGQIVCGLM